jgi:hypothetical protein
MNPNDPNALMLESVARWLGEDLLGDFVFVGGAVAGLLITDPAMPAIRPTEDVDLIVQVVALADYHRVEKVLMARGFAHDISQDAPVCRWRVGGIAVDVMPTLEHVLGFSNPWYPLAVSTAQPTPLASGTVIRLVAAPVFLATKLEAFAGRGNRDYLFSHDLGDFLSVVDGRDGLIDECRASPAELQAYLGKQVADLLATTAFIQAMPGHLPGDYASQARLPDLEDKLRALARLEC